MSLFTEEQFNKLSARERYQAYTEMKIDKTAFDNLSTQLISAVDKIKKMEQKIERITSELAVSKNVNTALSKCVTSLRRQVNTLDQYCRKENIEVSGIPKNFSNLEEKLIQLLNKIDVNVTSKDIVACHPLKREGSAIIRFCNRKKAELALKNSRKLKGLDNSAICRTTLTNYLNVNLHFQILNYGGSAKS